jgi:predicted deacylase
MDRSILRPATELDDVSRMHHSINPGSNLGNAAVRSVFQDSASHQDAIPVQRAPDPAKVAEAAQQAHASDDAAQALQALTLISQVMQAMPGQLPLMGVMLQLQLMQGMPVGVDGAGNPVMAHVFPGQIGEVAMVVAGVHGSEQSGVEVAENLISQLQANKPYYTVVVVPRLFPGNVASREAWEQKLAKDQSGMAVGKYRQLRDKAGDIGRVTPGQTDPNRQFPDLGKDVDLDKPVDSKGRLIEPSNLALLALVKSFKPTRVVSIHAIKNFTEAGIYADPHRSVKGFENDPTAKTSDELATAMAKEADKRGVHVAGNKHGSGWSSLYPGQNPNTSAAQMKTENARGRSFGQWGPSKGMAVITVEVGEQYRSDSAVQDPGRAAELQAEATVIREIFLGPPLPAPAPAPATPATPVQPLQRMLLDAAGAAGNRATCGLARRFEH